MSFCTSFPNRGRRCIFPFAYIPIGKSGFAHFSAKIFKKIFQRHKKSLENRIQAGKYISYSAPKFVGIWGKKRKKRQKTFICAAQVFNPKYSESKDALFNARSKSETLHSFDYLPA